MSCFDWGPVFLTGGQHCGSVPIPADKAIALSTQQAYLANQEPFWTATLDIFVAMNGFYGKYVMWPLKEHLEKVQSGKTKGLWSKPMASKTKPHSLIVHIGIMCILGCAHLLSLSQLELLLTTLEAPLWPCAPQAALIGWYQSMRWSPFGALLHLGLSWWKQSSDDDELRSPFNHFLFCLSHHWCFPCDTWVWKKKITWEFWFSKSKRASTCLPDIWPQNGRNARCNGRRSLSWTIKRA